MIIISPCTYLMMWIRIGGAATLVRHSIFIAAHIEIGIEIETGKDPLSLVVGWKREIKSQITAGGLIKLF